MDWRDVAAIVFTCTAVNHLGLIAAIERILKRKIPVVDCPKCLTCWSVTAYLLLTGHGPIRSLATALLCSYAALWTELFMYAIDTLYNSIYDTLEDHNPEDGGAA